MSFSRKKVDWLYVFVVEENKSFFVYHNAEGDMIDNKGAVVYHYIESNKPWEWRCVRKYTYKFWKYALKTGVCAVFKYFMVFLPLNSIQRFVRVLLKKIKRINKSKKND